MEFTKLSSPSLKELFINELQTLILSGKLPIGSKLPSERELATTMEVSRAVINGGITELTRMGFLTIKPRIGTFVADFRKEGTLETFNAIMNYNGGVLRDDEIKSILELRIYLDTLALKLCIPKIQNFELEALKANVNAIKEASSLEQAAEQAFNFQHNLAYFSGNTLLPLVFSSFKSLVISLWIRFCSLYGIEALYENTASLCAHIEQGDVEKAIESQTKSIEDTISGSRKIFY